MMESILIVDDTPDNLRTLATMLLEAGYDVRLARSGALALESVYSLPPNLILLDIHMPHMDGYQVCEQLKAQAATQNIPVIFLSVLSDMADKVKAFAVGGADYITKPFQMEEVLARVTAQLTICRLQHDLYQQTMLLDERVRERTAELEHATCQLQEEIAQRQQSQQQQAYLLEVVRQQSDQLSNVTHALVAQQQHERDQLARTIQDQLSNNVTRLHESLTNACRIIQCHQSRENALHHHLQTMQQIVQQIEQTLDNIMGNLTEPHAHQQIIKNPLLLLTMREGEVLHLLIDGKTNTQIADILCLAPSTVQTYRTRVMKKLNVDTFADLVRIAMNHM